MFNCRTFAFAACWYRRCKRLHSCITLNPTKSKYQWVYTAITRSSCRLHLVHDFFYGNNH